MAKSKKNKSDKAPSVCNLILPVKVDHLKGIAQTLVEDGKLTVSDVNGGRFTAEEVEQAWGIWDEEAESFNEGSMNDAFYRDLKNVPAVPAMHQPVLLQAAKNLGMTFAFTGQAKRNAEEPETWPNHLPSWKPGYTVDDRGGRMMSPNDIRRNVTDDKYLVDIGSYQYVVGDDKNNALHNLHGSKGDNTYGWNCRAIKKLAFRGRDKELSNIVFQINNSISTVAWSGDRTEGSQVIFLPNMLATAGYLVRSGKTMTYTQIAKAAESGDAKGIRFKALSEPIVGNAVTKNQLVSAVKKSMQANSTKDEKGNTAWDLWVKSKKGKTQADKEAKAVEDIWYNANVQTRNNVTVLNCFGLRNSVMDQALAIVYGDDRNDKRITCIVGQRCGDELTFQTRDAIRAEAADEAEAEAEAEAPEPKAEKPKRKKRKSTKKVKEPEAEVEPEPEAEDVPAAEEITDTADDAAEATEAEAEVAEEATPSA